MVTPFKHRSIQTSAPMRVLHRFTKPGGRVLEIRERKVTPFNALEWLVYFDGSLTESRMYHGQRISLYAEELRQRVEGLKADGWTKTEPPQQDWN